MTDPARLRVVVFCGDDWHHRYLIDIASRTLNLVGVVTEPIKSQRRRLLRDRRWTDCGFSTLHAFRRKALGLDAYRRRAFRTREVPTTAGHAEVFVDDINAPLTIEFAKRHHPDVVLLMGVSILSPSTLAALDTTVLNIHGGYLPDYRGNHCIFFALLHRRFDRIGSTIHFVDAGIDTGDIIAHTVPHISPTDQAEALYCKAEKLAICRIIELLHDLEHGMSLPRVAQPYRGRLYRMRDRTPLHDLIVYWRVLCAWLAHFLWSSDELVDAGFLRKEFGELDLAGQRRSVAETPCECQEVE